MAKVDDHVVCHIRVALRLHGRTFDKNIWHFYGLPLDLCEKHIVVLFAKRAVNFTTTRDSTKRKAP